MGGNNPGGSGAGPPSGPSTLEGPGDNSTGNNNPGNTTKSVYKKDGSYTQTTYDSNGKVVSETKVDSKGNITKYTVYNQDGTRTVTEYTFTKNGIIVTTKENQKRSFLGWSTGNISISGYNNINDLSSGNWNFRINNDGRVTANNWLVNGDLLAKACTTYLSNINLLDRYRTWYNLIKTGGLWDFKDRSRLPDSSFTFDGKTYNAEQFGNINYGYTGGFLGLLYNTLIDGSIYAANGDWKQDMHDWAYIAKGFISQTGDTSQVNQFNHMFNQYGPGAIDFFYIPLIGEIIRIF